MNNQTKKKFFSIYIICALLLSTEFLYAQKVVIRDPEIIPLQFLGETGPLSDFQVDPDFPNEITRDEKLGTHPKKDFPIHQSVNPNALPKGEDPALQKVYARSSGERALSLTYDGMGYTNVNPPDPSLDVGPNHVIQMINGSSGSYFQIYDKAGGTLMAQTYFDNFFGLPGGAGDPIVLYDQLANRWFMSEFASAGNNLHIAISTTPDPLGTWYTYIFNTPDFPDYPKYAVWPDAYYVTTNESASAVYALDRIKMLAGDASATSQRFTVPDFPNLSFQTATPVDLDGSTPPPAGTPGFIMRMVDDAWGPGVNADHLEIWEFDVDFVTPANSSLSGPDTLHTIPFDTDLCGLTSFSCIDQPGGGSADLDPLREVLMNRVHYRNFGTYQTIICNHVTDVDNTDHAGVRWYELRKPASDWNIYQQGTYAPDGDNRWMAGIAMNDDGSIGLAYNVSSSTTFPSLRYTGRKPCDSLGIMTEPETTIAAGSASNGSNRYGDYSEMSVDPLTGDFWFTGEYNPASQWSTRIARFDIGDCNPSVQFESAASLVQEADADVNNVCLDYKEYDIVVKIALAPSQPATLTFGSSGTATESTTGDYSVMTPLVTLNSTNLSDTVVVRVYNDGYVESDETIILDYVLNANGGDAVPGSSNQTHTITVKDDDVLPSASQTIDVINADFESGAEGFTSVNAGSGDTWALGTNTTASSGSFAVPSNNSGQLFFVNDDACDCDMADVKLISPIFDLSNISSPMLTFHSYFEGNTFQGKTEEASLEVSLNGAPFVQIPGSFLSGAEAWQTLSFDLSAYTGNNNVRIAFKYNDDNGWLYGWVVDNVIVTGEGSQEIQTDINSSMADEEYLGPFETVHFYDPLTNNIMATIQNLSATDFGCTTVEVDRSGTTPTAIPFSSFNPSTFLHSKAFKFTPSNLDSGLYQITLFYKENEVATWETLTSNSRNDAQIIKVGGNNSIDDVNPGNFMSFDIENVPATLTPFGDNVTFSAQFSSGFSGFGVGRVCEYVVSNTDDIGSGSLRDVLGCVGSGDTVRFDIALTGDTIDLTSSLLTINKNVVILSNPGEITIDASALTGAFVVTSGTTAELHGIRVLSGTALLGRAILNQGNLLIKDIIAEDNSLAPDGEMVSNLGNLEVLGNCQINH